MLAQFLSNMYQFKIHICFLNMNICQRLGHNMNLLLGINFNHPKIPLSNLRIRPKIRQAETPIATIVIPMVIFLMFTGWSFSLCLSYYHGIHNCRCWSLYLATLQTNPQPGESNFRRTTRWRATWKYGRPGCNATRRPKSLFPPWRAIKIYIFIYILLKKWNKISCIIKY